MAYIFHVPLKNIESIMTIWCPTGSLDSDLTLTPNNNSPSSSPPSSPKMFPSHHHPLDDPHSHNQQQQQQQQQQLHPQQQHAQQQQQHHHHPGQQQRLRVTMPQVNQQQQQGQQSLNTPLPQSAGSPTGGINWILPSPDRTFYAPLFGILTPTSQPQQLTFNTDSPNSASQFGGSQSEFSFDPSCISMTDDPFRQQQQQQQPQQQQQQQQQSQQQVQQPKYHPWATSDFDQSTQEQLVIPKQEPFAEYCTGGPPSVETTASHDSSATQQSVGLAEYNPSTSKGHEILSQVGDTFQVGLKIN